MTTKADPKRPYKAIAAVVTAIVSYLLTQQLVHLSNVAQLVLMCISIALATYFVPNPRVEE